MNQLKKYIILIFLTQLFTSCNEDIAPNVSVATIEQATIKLQSDNKYVAGQDIRMLVSTSSKIVKQVDLIITNGLTISSSKELTNKITKLDGHLFKTAGLYDLKVLDKGHMIAKRQFKINADKIIEPLDVYAGPSSIIVGGKQPSMITTIPTDQYDNAITSKETINITSKEGQRINSTVTTQNLIASYEFQSKNNSDKIILGVTHDNSSSREKEIVETPDWAVPYDIEIVKHYPYADNRQYLRLRTSRIADNLDNQIADGTMVHFYCYENKKLYATYQAIVIDGIANVYIRNPNQASDWVVKSAIGPVESKNELTINFRNNVKELIYTYDDFLKEIKVGPLKSTHGQLIPDGTIVTITYQSQKYIAETDNGIAHIKLVELGILGKGSLHISVSGLSKNIEL